MRFFSPPEKPFVDRARGEVAAHFQQVHLLVETVVILDGFEFLALAETRLHGGADEIGVAHAGDLHRVLEREEQPLAGAFVGFQAEDFLAVEQDAAAGDLVIRVAGDRLGQRALARAVQPHDGVNLALGDFEAEAFDDGLVTDAHAKVFDDER